MTGTRVLHRSITTASARVLAERPALVVTGVFYLIVTTALSTVWSAAARGHGGSIIGYSAGSLVWYIATSEVCTIALPMRLIEEIGNDIGSGRIETELLRPASVVGVRVASEIGRMLPRMCVCIAVGTAFARIAGGPAPSGAGLALALVALPIALVTNLLMQHIVASWSFWIRDAKGGWFLYSKLIFVLGGLLLPIEVLPNGLQSVAKLLPFASMAYAPARLASGHVEPWLIVRQLVWVMILGVAAVRAFARGERRLTGARS